jgi:hypothetical protein
MSTEVSNMRNCSSSERTQSAARACCVGHVVPILDVDIMQLFNNRVLTVAVKLPRPIV